jgi:hypothetical protein
MKRLLIIVTALIVVMFSFSVALPHSAFALFEGSRDSACGGVALIDTPQPCATGSADTVTNLIRQGLELLSIVAGVTAVFMIIIAGLKFITSQGESASTASARNTILYAIVGLVVVVMAQFIVRFVLNKTIKDQAPKPTTSLQLSIKSLAVDSGDVV